jgi:antitoxin VapB
LNVKNPKAYALASELAKLTGESLTTVVISSLEQRLEAERVARGGKSKVERMMEFAEKFKEGMPPSSHSSDHNDLYGDDRLPI